MKIFKAGLVAGGIALGTQALGQDMPMLVIVNPAEQAHEQVQFAQDKLSLKVTTVDSTAGMLNDMSSDGDMIVFEYVDLAPSGMELTDQLAAIKGAAERITYVMIAKTSDELEPLNDVSTPDNVKFVMGVEAHDRALVAFSHSAAGTGYDGGDMYYRKNMALEKAVAQFRETPSGTMTGWAPGAQYILFDSDLVESGAPDKAVSALAAHAETLGDRKQTWFDIEAGAFTNTLPAATEDDMFGVYVNAVGATCSGYPWDGVLAPKVYTILRESNFQGFTGVWSQD